MIESPPEPYVEHMDNNHDNNIFDDPTISNEVDQIEDVATATYAVGQITEQDSIVEDMDSRYGPRSGRYHLRNRRKPNYGHLHHILHDKPVRSTDGFMQPDTCYSLNIMWGKDCAYSAAEERLQ